MMIRRNKILTLNLLAIILLLGSCKKDEEPPPPGEFGHGVFVVNEGNFTAGNASLTYYNDRTGEVDPQVFYRINGAPLGDVANSITMDEQSIFIVVNNSHVIYKINASTGVYEAKTSGLTSPRYLLKIDDNTALISDLYEHNLTVVNTDNMEIINRIPVGRTSENLLKYNEKVFVTNWSAYQQEKPNNVVMVVDLQTYALADTIQVGIEPNSMVMDKDNHLWVLCSGGYLNEEAPTLWKIDPESNTVITGMQFNNQASVPDNLHINKTGDTLYYLDTDVYRMPVTAVQLPGSHFIPAGNGTNFYALGISPHSHIYLSDANDYTRNGTVYRYNTKGILMDHFEAGIAPGNFGFQK